VALVYRQTFRTFGRMRGMKLPRFSVRALLILVAVASLPLGWVAYQLDWLRQRHKFFSSKHNKTFELKHSQQGLPLIARLVGEQSLGVIFVENADLPQAKWLFPEAQVYDIANPPATFEITQ
jgi:hypothetical protein